MNSPELPEDILAAALLGELGPDESRAVIAACAATPAGAARLERLRATIGALGEARALDPLFTVSRESRERLYAIAEAAPGLESGLGARLIDGVRTLVAALVPTPTPAGVRGGAARSLRLECPGVVIELRVSPPEVPPADPAVAVLEVLGRVRGGPRVTEARLLAGGVIARGAVDEQGFFELRAGAGTYDLELVGADARVLSPRVTLEA